MAPEQRTRRRSLRRAVTLECALRSDLWDREVRLSASNLSTAGMWLETSVALEPGSQVVVSFTPPGVQTGKRVWASAEVVRVSNARQRDDANGSTGMGLAFTYCSDRDLRLLARSLVGCPPRLPQPKVAPRERPAPLPHAVEARPSKRALGRASEDRARAKKREHERR